MKGRGKTMDTHISDCRGNNMAGSLCGACTDDYCIMEDGTSIHLKVLSELDNTGRKF